MITYTILEDGQYRLQASAPEPREISIRINGASAPDLTAYSYVGPWSDVRVDRVLELARGTEITATTTMPGNVRLTITWFATGETVYDGLDKVLPESLSGPRRAGKADVRPYRHGVRTRHA